MSAPGSADLSGKVAVVTGGSRGLGLEIVRALSRAGAAVAVASRKHAACDAVVQELNAAGAAASSHGIDAGVWQDCDRLYREVMERWGGAHILVNNAGMSPVAPSSLETSEQLFDKVIAVNLRSVFRLSSLFATRMLELGGGSIINISSSGSLRPRPNFAPYAAAKAGLNVLTATFAQEFGPSVRVNTVMPGPFHTGATSAWSRSEEFSLHAKRTLPLGRAGEPKEIAGAVVFLASDAASFTTGACLTVDGGHSIGI